MTGCSGALESPALVIYDPAAVVDQAASTNPGARWLVDGATRVLAVNPLPPPDACP